MIKNIKDIHKILKKYGFNPLVTTKGGLNTVNIKIAAKINKEELCYLKKLALRSKN